MNKRPRTSSRTNADSKQGLTKTKLPSARLFLLGLYVLVLCVAVFKAHNYVFDKKLDMNGDNTAYYLLGQNLAKNHEYTSIQHPANPPHAHFPPGYPALIAVYSFFTEPSINSVKHLNGLFLAGSVLLLFLLSYRAARNMHLSFIVCL